MLVFILSMTTLAMAQSEEDFIKNLTREGMMPEQLLQLSSDQLNGFDSYKFKVDMNMDINTELPEMEDAESTESTQNMKMNMTQEGVIETPQKVYVKSTSKVISSEEDIPAMTSEVFLDNNAMYMKILGQEKWNKIDINPFMKKMQELTGNNSAGNTGLSKDQIKLFTPYASFDEDITKDGKEYYVVNIKLDQDAFDKVYKEMFKSISEGFGDMFADVANQDEQTEEKIDKEELSNIMSGLFENMKMNVEYKMYIDKETKLHDSMDMIQKIEMNLEGIKTETMSNGHYTYYGFNEEVSFPVINAENVQ
ncbi:hypothetical protein IZY60_12550 [Lutibacter sp. B2]|nr:hypothetical protein [Lutibacter sp. B2]